MVEGKKGISENTSEFDENILAAQSGLKSASVHTLPIPLMKDEVWRISLLSDQILKLGMSHIEDPMWQLSDIYRRIALINQMTILRQSLVFSIVRTSPKYDQILEHVDSFLVNHFEELIPAMKRAKQNLSKRDFKEAFAKHPVYAEYASDAERRRQS